MRALLVELLRRALRDAGVVRSNAPLHPRRQALALAWLTGTLDDQVALPIGFVCDALGLDAGGSPLPCGRARPHDRAWAGVRSGPIETWTRS